MGTFDQVLAQHEIRDQAREQLSIERDNRIEGKIDSNHDKMVEAVRVAVKETVNGKIDKVNNNLWWMQKIFMFILPLAIALFGWSIKWEIDMGNQVAAVAQSVEDLTKSR